MQKQPRFVLSKPQQGAVFVLLICLISVQFFRYFSSVEGEQILSLEATLLNEQKLDSLQLLVEVKTGINFTFNPNFISDYKGYKELVPKSIASEYCFILLVNVVPLNSLSN